MNYIRGWKKLDAQWGRLQRIWGSLFPFVTLSRRENRGRRSGLDRRQREKGFFFPKFTKSNGPGIHEGYTHLDPSRDRFFHASPCSISISDEITYFSIVGNTPRDFLLVFFLFLGKGKENSKGYGAHNGPTFHR